jgi:glycosyltransferase involved in cell wall biosynthesis
VPHLTTLHGRLNLPDLVPLYRRFADEPVVSISNHQRQPLPWLNWQGTVYHGLPISSAAFDPTGGESLVFIGRICAEKRLDRAIEIARRCGRKLRVGAKVDKADREYFAAVIQPLLSSSDVEFLGEVNEQQKAKLVGNSAAMLFPIDWPEPFGLVMIEAMAYGTPVIAWNCGSVPEIITDGVTGFVCESIDQAVDAVGRIPTLSRERCREEFDVRFRAARMAEDYVRIYERLVGQSGTTKEADHGRSHRGSGSVLHSGNLIAGR